MFNRGALAAFDGLCDDGAPRWPMAIGKRSPALQEPIFGVFGAPNFTNTPKKQKVIGIKKIISGLLTVLRRPVYASVHYKCPKSVHRNYCFLPLYAYHTSAGRQG